MPCRAFSRVIVLGWLLAAVALPLRAQDMPDLATLPVLQSDGALAAEALPDQGFWLAVTEPGLYRLALDGAGAIALTGFDTADGRSDGSDRQTRLLEAGSAYEAGVLDDLLLLPGHAYLIQVAGLEPRGVTLARTMPIDPAAALAGTAIGGRTPEAQLAITTTDAILLRTEDALDLTLSTGETSPLMIETIAAPEADVMVRFEGQETGAGGLFPVLPFDTARLQIDSAPGLDAELPLMLVRARLLPDPGRYDEVEPGDNQIGALPPDGRDIRGALLSGRDRDVYLVTLDQPGRFDLGLDMADGGPVSLVLWHDDGQGSRVDLLRADPEQGSLWRPGLSLLAGTLVIEISGDRTTPVDYRLSLTAAPDAGNDPDLGEPDDQPVLARMIETGQTLRGELADENPGHVRFAVTTDDHLWELRGVQGLRDIGITDGNGVILGQWEAANGALALRLGLPPGIYTAALRGDGPYAIRLSDLGPIPAGSEIEPNDDGPTTMPIAPGDAVTGDFMSPRDRDLYEITLAAPTPLMLTVTGPDDGAAVVDLTMSDAGTLRAELVPGTGTVSYAALFAPGRHVIEWRARDEGVSGRYTMRFDRVRLPEPDEPHGVAAMPGDGRIAGQIGGFDAEDRVFLPLPTGAGMAALTCTGALTDWEVVTYHEETRILRAGRGETAMLAYAPELGGALELRATANPGTAPGPYDCRIRFAPSADPLPLVSHDEAAEASAPMAVSAGTRISGQTADDRDTDSFVLAMAAGDSGGLRCTVPTDQIRSGGKLQRALDQPPLTDGTHPFLADTASIKVEIRPAADGPFPADWACDVIEAGSFATPQMMGPAAPFVGYHTPGAEPLAYDPAAALAVLSGGRPDWLSPTQVTADLALDLAIDGLDLPFRAFARPGQSAELVLKASNPGKTPLDLRFDIAALADGWRITPSDGTLRLEPGHEGSLALQLEVPPMQSPVTDPKIMVTAHAGTRITALTVPVTLDPAASERSPGPFWSAPAALRGGLDPMRWQLGARLIALDAEPISDETAREWAHLHDGDAPHTGTLGWFRAHQATFRLAETAPVAGLVVHLRSTEDRSTWPPRITLELSEDGVAWQKALQTELSVSDLPQVFALPGPVTAGLARITIPGCRLDPNCQGVALADVGLVASPDWRLSAPLDLADPLLGGHVVAGLARNPERTEEMAFGGPWNINLLTEGQRSEIEERRDDRGPVVEALIGFHAGRAARIAAVEWVGHPDDIARLDGAKVAVSIAGPAGPWQEIGTLSAPAPGTLTARFDLPAPVWARTVHLTFARDAAEPRALPDRIRIWEDPSAPPLLGLWEDDRPDAGYEATVAPPGAKASPPTGGPDADNPAPLMFGQTVTSSVQLGRNVDFWQIDLPQGPPQRLSLRFAGAAEPVFTAHLMNTAGDVLPLDRAVTPEGDLILSAPLPPGQYLLQIDEPPRSVTILWDTSGSVQSFVPGILAAVRLWSQSLQPGRDRLQLLPFGQETLLLDDWAGSPEEIYPFLSVLPTNGSSDSEAAVGIAATALAGQDGQRGIVVITDAETAQSQPVWAPLLRAVPRVVALSVDSGDVAGVAIMKDWASVNGGYFTRITGNAGLADGLDLAAALFRAPKGYSLTASTEELREPEGTGELILRAAPLPPDAAPTGGIEVILDASGSMLQRLPDGQRRIAVAHQALTDLVRTTLPPGTPFAFRAFGLAEDACLSELILPLGPLDPEAAAAAIEGVPAINLAKTAIAASLALAAEDLANVSPPRVIVLVTDGEETCDGDIDAEIVRLAALGLDLRLTIVGFAIDDAALAADFAGWAAQGNGQYLDAGDQAALAAAMTEAIAPRFGLERLYLDGRTEAMGAIGLETAMALPAGRYRLRPLQTAQGPDRVIDIGDSQIVERIYDATQGLLDE